MKKLLIMLLIGTAMFSQSKTTVRGVTLDYDKVHKVMTLKLTPKSVYTNDTDMDVVIEIHKQFALKMAIGGVTYSMTEPYFKQKGHTRDMGWIFTTIEPSGCIELKKNYTYQFKDIHPGEEYILEVSNVCDDKYTTNSKSGSILIN
jgi:hypothetical protein